jgi:hypothetical protein
MSGEFLRWFSWGRFGLVDNFAVIVEQFPWFTAKLVKPDCGGRPKTAPAFSAFPPSMAVRFRSEQRSWPAGHAAGAACNPVTILRIFSKRRWIPAFAGMTSEMQS